MPRLHDEVGSASWVRSAIIATTGLLMVVVACQCENAGGKFQGFGQGYGSKVTLAWVFA